MRKLKRLLALVIALFITWGAYASTREETVNNHTDFSNRASITIDEPRLAYVNITGITSLPTSKQENLHAWLEYSDEQGNSFRKRVILNAQGASSLSYAKKSFAIDFCEDEWVGNLTTNITIGNWVTQDGFHLKANWLDSFRGGLAVMTAYRLYDDIVSDRPHILARAEMVNYSDRVLCHPDGFPCVLYLNGEFYGIYAWQLKKHRKNMGMKKNHPLHVWFQLESYTSSFETGEVIWEHINIKNPKEVTEETKEIINRFANYNKELKELSYSIGRDAMRAEIAKRYDIESFIDFILHGILTANIDGFGKNAQYFTYDGEKWFVTPYDLDMTFGLSWIGSFIFPAKWSYINTNYTMYHYTNGIPFNWIMEYFFQEIKERYATLRSKGIISTDYIMRHLEEWNRRVGEEYYNMEYAKWSMCPSNGTPKYNDGWTFVADWSSYEKLPAYLSNKSYAEGECCTYDYRVWRATKPIIGIPPVATKGFTDTEDRVRNWLTERIAFEDIYFEYSIADGVTTLYLPAPKPTKRWLIDNRIVIDTKQGLYTIDGKKSLHKNLEQTTIPSCVKINATNV